MDKNIWYEQVRRDTLHLIHIKSVSPGPGEIEVAHAILDLLCLDAAAPGYTTYGLDPLQHDPYARQNVFAFIQGQSLDTIVLLAHFDTVDTTDYGDLADLALDPEQLTALPNIQNRLTRGSPPPDSETASDWLFGRGTSDMKTGVAIHRAIMPSRRKSSRYPSRLSFWLLLTKSMNQLGYYRLPIFLPIYVLNMDSPTSAFSIPIIQLPSIPAIRITMSMLAL
jgi:arginine utilization protein RocB